MPSPRNSEEGQLNLLKQTDCSKLLRAESISVQALLNVQSSLQSFVVPSLDDLLDETPVPHYPYTKTYLQGRSDTHVIFHTSGSTGLPKPIFSPEEAVCSVEISSTIPNLNGKPYSYTHLARKCRRFFCNLPLFHAAGFILGLHYPAYFDTVAVLGPPRRPLSASLLNDMILYGDVQGLYGPPATLEEATKISSYLENLSKLDIIICATGPLSSHAGAAVASRTHLSLCSGSTESYLMPTHVLFPFYKKENRKLTKTRSQTPKTGAISASTHLQATSTGARNSAKTSTNSSISKLSNPPSTSTQPLPHSQTAPSLARATYSRSTLQNQIYGVSSVAEMIC